ncbi:sulfite exporter TauE/SafE family protein [Streptomyces sp. NBC_01725]|uniref:sulfite exporter TauE/SafE family protein n=1 Tax=unclassified Streptomyces TaxID=2593676 RepID=UPI0011CAA2B8|nr:MULTISPECIES: sulfite exporter TauE/SafE family protein [unclassified Streptomyces]TXL89964.1 sulfite exporter TauE/SafE family protein [Streptomyces sp. IB2014 016-6]
MSLPTFALLSAVVLLGTVFQVSIGFGLGLLAAPVIALAAPSLVPVVLLLSTGVTASVLLLDGAHVNLRGAGWALLGRVPGVIAGAALVALLPARWLALCVAGVVVVGVLASVRGFRPAPTRRAVALAGMASGLMGTATSIGGPPMALVWQRMTGPELRSTMSGFFLAGSLMSLVALAAVGAVHADSLRYSALLAPAAAGGVLLARPLSDKLNVGRARAVATVLAVAGAALLTVRQFV